MKTTPKNQRWQKIAGLGGLALIILLALVVPNSGLFQANLPQTTQLHKAAEGCQKIEAITLPQSPLPANTPAVVALHVLPETFTGTFTYSASSGNLNDERGNVGSYIQTSATQVNYSGGENGTTITVQANGEENKNCLVTIPVIQKNTTACESLKVVSDPTPLPQDQSAALTLIPTPSDFKGTYLFQADSGEFQMQDADVQASGNHTKTLVTGSTNVLYNGGKIGEKIVVKVLGSGSNCIVTIPITQ